MSHSDAIAVIGMSCRFPGARNIQQFWDNLKNGIESVTQFSDQELTEAGVTPSQLNHPDYVRSGFIIEGEDQFDASFFGYSPREAEIMDPQQRLFLETVWEALEDGGYAAEQYDGSIGVFAGSRMSSYMVNVMDSKALALGDSADLQVLIANDKDYLTSRVSFKLNLRGPSITVQSACSTSLVAVHQACDSLFLGGCDMALAGGVSLNLPQKKGYLFQEGMVLSSDGHCRVFDAGANGLVPGNGVGVVLLKRLEDAFADRDAIHAVITGSAVNNDGSHKVGYTTPSVTGQLEVIREAQGVSGVSPDSISYIEAHGTGTVLGDPVETEALCRAFAEKTEKKGFCAIGSVKSNIGHLDTAAGIAGFIKTVLCLKHGYMVPSLNYEQPNPKINFKNSPFYVNTQFSPWQVNGHPRRAGISSFGFGGTNAHVILEEAPDRPVKQSSLFPFHLLTLSAKTQNALTQQIHNYRSFLENNPNVLVDEICFTANTGRSHFRYRFAAVASSKDDLHLQLTAAVQKKSLPTLFQGITGDQAGPKVTFDLIGQSFNHDLLTSIASDTHVLQDLYRLPVMLTDKGESKLLLSALGKLYVHGADIDWEGFYQDHRSYRIPLPTYPFEKQRHWISSITDRTQNMHQQALTRKDIDATALWHAAIKEGDARSANLAFDLDQFAGYNDDLALLCSYYTLDTLKSLGLFNHADEIHSVSSLVARAGIIPKYSQLMSRLLNALVMSGNLQQQEKGYCHPTEIDPDGISRLLEKMDNTYPGSGEWMKVISLCGEQLDSVLTGQADPREVLFPKGTLGMVETAYQDNEVSSYFNGIITGVVDSIQQMLPQHTRLHILEIGAGTGATTREILPVLQSEKIKYVFTDISPVFLNHAETKFKNYSFVEYKTLDIESSPKDQEFEEHGYDLIIAANVLHATRDLNVVMNNVASLLAPNGMLILREITTPQIMFDLIFGPVLNVLTDEALRGGKPFLSPEKWEDLFETSGFIRTRAFSDTDRKLGEHILISQMSPQSLPDVPSAFTRPVSPNNPLAGRRLLSPVPVFEFKLDLEALDLIKNHRIFDDIVLPGAAFFEMAANVGEQMFSTYTCLKEVTLHHPLVLPDDNTQKTIQIVLEPDGTEEEQPFKIFSLTRPEDDPAWELHVSGIIQAVQAGSKDDVQDMPPFSSIQEKFCKTDNLVRTVNGSEDVFRIESIWRNQQEALVSIQASPEETEGNLYYKIHPLILNPVMQSLVQAFIKKAENPEEKEVMYIPAKVGHVRCYGYLAGRLWCYLSVHGDDAVTSAGFSFDCRVLDQSGTCVAEFIGIYVHRIDPMSLQWKKAGQENLFYQIEWQAQPLQPDDDLCFPGKWVIFSDQKGVGQHIADLLESRDEFCIQIYADTGAVQSAKNTYVIDAENPDDYDRLFQNLPKEMSQFGMIHLWSMDAAPDDYTKCGSLLHIAKAMVNAGKVSERLCIVTQGVYKVKGHKTPVSVAQAPISGLAKVLAKEHPELNCLSIDTDALDADSALLQIIDEIQHANSDRETAFRDGVRYVPRLISCFPGIKKEPPCINNQGTYLITGAFGGLGMALAQWIIRGGGQHLLLAGRNKPNDDALKQIKEIEELGGSVHTLIADVSDFKTFSSGFNAVREGMPPLKGVFHLAGILKGDMILQQSYKDFAEIMAPKAAGAWNLHQLTQDIPLDFFVLFSTSSTLWGIQGVGAYTAANTFLDSLAHYRASQGLPALSINWGTWARIGAAAELHLEDRLSGQGFNSLSPEACFECLEVLLKCDMDQAGVMAMDWKKFLSRFPKNGRPPLFSSLKSAYSSVVTPKNKTVASGEKVIPSSDILQKLPAHERQALMRTYLRKEISRILRIWEDKISDDQNLIELGMDSLIFIELSQTLGKDLQLKIVPHKIFENPTIAAMAQQFIGDIALDKTVSVLDSKLIQDITITHDINNRYAPFDLTDIQQAYWIGRVNTLELGNIACHVYMEIDASYLDYARYNQAWQSLILRHEMLRAIILPDGSQRILETVPDYKINIADLTGKSLEQAEAALASIRDFMSHQVLDPEEWPIFDIRISRINNETSRIHLSLDMLIVDALSVSQLMKELSLLYQDESASLPPLELSFRDYVLAEKQFEKSDLFQQSKAYWMNRLTDIPPGPELPLIKNPGDVAVPHFKRRTLKLEPDTWKQLKAKAANAGLTASGLLLSCYAEILSTWSKTPRFTVNMTIFNRLPVHPQVDDIIGDFTSLIMLVVDAGGHNTFIERAQKIQAQFWRDVEHRHFSGVRVIRELSRIQSGNVSMPVVFTSNLVYGDLDEIRMDSSAIGEVVYTVTQTPQVWLDHQITEQGNTLVLDWDAVEELFPEGMLDDMFNAYHSLLSRLAASDDWHVNWDLMPADQVLQRKDINETAKPISPETLNSLFIKQAEQQPDHTAVITSSVDISYKDLHHQSMVIASQLVDHGAISNTLIAVVMEKGWEQVVAVLGILNAGAAYLPIDPAVPKDRLWHLLEDGDVKFVLTQSWLDGTLEWPKDVEVCCVDTQDYTRNDLTPVQVKQTPDDLAYVIHTSGSTGLPKGVMIDHKGAVNTILDINNRYHLTRRDRVFALSNLNFDLSVYDIFGTLASGATIIMPDDALRKDPGHWLSLIKEKHVTVWNSVPALMQMLVEYVSGREDLHFNTLRLVLLSGDWIPLDLPDKIRKRFDPADIISLGGATEASIWSILYAVNTVDPNWNSIPYGWPMVNQEFYVLNENMEPCPDWVPGKLYIGGSGLAKGYWRDEEKTKASFIQNPKIGKPLYRTGDLGRFLPDGNIEFLGREDQQVKINGYRIELGEIESGLKQIQGITDSVVIPVADQEKNRYLVGHIITEPEYGYTDKDLKQMLEKALPAYMVPRFYLFHDAFPVSVNGKIDRKRLSEQNNRAFPVDDIDYLAPQTPTEQMVSEILKKILNLEEISTKSLFFDIGATSMHLVRLQNKLRENFNNKVKVVDIFKYPTIYSLSQFLDSKNEKFMDVDIAGQRGKLRLKLQRNRHQTTRQNATKISKI